MTENGLSFWELDGLFLRCRRPLWDGRAPPVDVQRYCGEPTTPGMRGAADAPAAGGGAPQDDAGRRGEGQDAAGRADARPS